MKISEIIKKLKDSFPFIESEDNASDLETLIYSSNEVTADIAKQLKYSDEHMLELVSKEENVSTRAKRGKTSMGKSVVINPIIKNVESQRNYSTFDENQL